MKGWNFDELLLIFFLMMIGMMDIQQYSAPMCDLDDGLFAGVVSSPLNKQLIAMTNVKVRVAQDSEGADVVVVLGVWYGVWLVR